MLKKYFFAGLLIWLPIWATLVVIRFLIEVLDSSFSLLPKAYRPETLLGIHVPGLGIFLALVVILITGMFVTNVLGRSLVGLWEKLLAKIPIVRTIYNAVKQVLETIFSSSSDSFRQVLLVEYPRKGLWSVAFQTGRVCDEVKTKITEDMITIFIPTTPNPTSGFLMLVARAEVIELDMSVDDALKMIISLGMVQPPALPANKG